MTNEEFIQSIALLGEEWRDVVGLEGLYAVSSEGRVASMRTKKIMSQTPQTHHGRTYMHVCLYQNHAPKKVRVHQLVAEAFIPNREIGDEVDHISNNPLDNRVENLRWCSHQENMRNPHTREKQRAYRLSHPFTKRGRPHKPDPSVFFNNHDDTRKDVVQMKDGEVIARYKSIGEAARVNGYNKAAISQACNHIRVAYKHFVWMFATEYESQVSMSKNSNPNPDDSYAASGDTSCKMPE